MAVYYNRNNVLYKFNINIKFREPFAFAEIAGAEEHIAVINLNYKRKTVVVVFTVVVVDTEGGNVDRMYIFTDLLIGVFAEAGVLVPCDKKDIAVFIKNCF